MDLSHNFFKLFEIPVSFTVDLASLSATYRALQGAVHPDKFASGTDQEKLLSARQSALINDAYQTLKKPLTRARYLLSLQGIEISDNQTSMEPAFLMQQMELRESIAEIRSSSDAYDHAIKLADEIQGLTREILQEIADMFSVALSENAGADKKLLDKLIDYTNRLQFMNKLNEEVQQLEEELI